VRAKTEEGRGVSLAYRDLFIFLEIANMWDTYGIRIGAYLYPLPYPIRIHDYAAVSG
jgi:hypothetical protein